MFLKLENVKAKYGEVEVLHGVHLNVEKGEMVALIGPNGSGKSTTLKSIFGLVKPFEGRITFKGKELRGKEPFEVVREGISIAPQGRRVFPNLTVEENLELGGFIVDDQALVRERMREVFERFPNLKERRGAKARVLSGGEQQMLSIGRALMLEPDLLLLDEPSLGLSPLFVERIFDKLRDLNETEGMAILVVEQNAVKALKSTHRAFVFEAGAVKVEGESSKLLKDPKVRKAYLGI